MSIKGGKRKKKERNTSSNVSKKKGTLQKKVPVQLKIQIVHRCTIMIISLCKSLIEYHLDHSLLSYRNCPHFDGLSY